jgi:hypothetical protein
VGRYDFGAASFYRKYQAHLAKAEAEVAAETPVPAMPEAADDVPPLKFGCPGGCKHFYQSKSSLRGHQRKSGCGMGDDGVPLDHVGNPNISQRDAYMEKIKDDHRPVGFTTFMILKPHYVKFHGRAVCECSFCCQMMFFCAAWCTRRKTWEKTDPGCHCNTKQVPVTPLELLGALLCDKGERSRHLIKCIRGECRDCGVQKLVAGTCDELLCCEKETDGIILWPSKESAIKRNRRIKTLCEERLPADAETITVSIIRPRITPAGDKKTDFEDETLTLDNFFTLMMNVFAKWAPHFDRSTYMDQELRKKLDSLPRHSVLINMDFGQNGSLDEYIEHQSKAWMGSGQYTVHPVAIRADIRDFKHLDGDFVEEFIRFRTANNLSTLYTQLVYFLSDDLKHDRFFVKRVLQVVHEKYLRAMDLNWTCDCDERCTSHASNCDCTGGENPTCTRICHIVTDGCGTQYKNGPTIWEEVSLALEQGRMVVDWIFQASLHGKDVSLNIL